MPGFRLESPMSKSLVHTPLAPQVLHKAGVPLEDTLWFIRQRSPSMQMMSLSTPRGEGILVHVRKFMQQVNASHAIPIG